MNNKHRSHTKHNSHSITAVLTELEVWALKEGTVTIGSLVHRLGERGLGLIVVVLSIPFVQPLPMFGLSSVIGAVVMVVGLAMALEKSPWIPQKLSNKNVPVTTVLSICSAGKKLFTFTEKFIRPRGKWLYESKSFQKLSGLFIFFSALLLALPIPVPGTNTPPALAMLLLSLGFIERDAVAVILGYVCFFVTVAYFLFIGWGLLQGANMVLPKLGF